MFELGLVPLLALHLLAMNVAAAGPLVCMALEFGESRGDQLATKAANFLAGAVVLSLIFGGLLGVAFGALHWTNHYPTVWTVSLRHKAWWGVGEFCFSLILSAAYWWWRTRFTHHRRPWRYVLLVLSGANLLYHFPFLFSVAANLSLQSELPPPLGPGEFRQLMLEPDTIARVVHVVLASFAVTGIALLSLALRMQYQNQPTADYTRLARRSAWLALLPTLVQLPIGVWLIAVSPPAWQANVLGGDLVATGLLSVSVLLALVLMQDLATIALGEVQRRQLVRTMVLLVVVVLFMTGVLRRMRIANEAVPIARNASSATIR